LVSSSQRTQTATLVSSSQCSQTAGLLFAADKHGVCNAAARRFPPLPPSKGIKVDQVTGGWAGGRMGNGHRRITSPSKSRSRSKSLIFGWQGSRVMSRQRSDLSSMKHNDRAEEFSFGELAEATKNFSLETKIGAESEPQAKKFQKKAFQSKLSFLSRLHHKHLVGLVDYYEDREERLFVYEYMKNGALFDHLHIACGNGGGNGAVPPIIHRDIKSSNILLDGSWTAKVSNFGPSLNGPDPARSKNPPSCAPASVAAPSWSVPSSRVLGEAEVPVAAAAAAAAYET
ncbi:hypothetical protein Taro_012885, partial [Colocasia esculenta]|nr:hypothetical protein [Colocasia esculenta]